MDLVSLWKERKDPKKNGKLKEIEIGNGYKEFKAKPKKDVDYRWVRSVWKIK
jgi:hypothetical protein